MSKLRCGWPLAEWRSIPTSVGGGLPSRGCACGQTSGTTFMASARSRHSAIGCVEARSASFEIFSWLDSEDSGMSPIDWVNAQPHKTMKTRMRLIGYWPHPSVRDRVPMDVGNRRIKVFLASQSMRPKPALPNPPFSALHPALRDSLAHGQGSGKASLEQAPPHDIIRVFWR